MSLGMALTFDSCPLSPVTALTLILTLHSSLGYGRDLFLLTRAPYPHPDRDWPLTPTMTLILTIDRDFYRDRDLNS